MVRMKTLTMIQLLCPLPWKEQWEWGNICLTGPWQTKISREISMSFTACDRTDDWDISCWFSFESSEPTAVPCRTWGLGKMRRSLCRESLSFEAEDSWHEIVENMKMKRCQAVVHSWIFNKAYDFATYGLSGGIYLAFRRQCWSFGWNSWQISSQLLNIIQHSHPT